MLTPGYANLWVHFYPIGNTPAVSLTQGLPPEKDANILLLGCGDIRNILFTVHSDKSRRMDVTCCDIEPAIIARNILLVTLIVDDSNDHGNNDNWDMYYHVFIDKTCHDRLQKQAMKLHGLAASLEAWREGDYGNLVAFCDSGTLTRVAEFWAFYISAATERQSWMKKTFRSVIETRKQKRRDTGLTATGVRSATPSGMLAGLELNELHEHFWKHGTMYMDHVVRSQATYANPLFASPGSTVKLHYAIDPLLGFHLSTAYVPLAHASQQSQGSPRVSKTEGVVAAARAEFLAWSNTFKARGRENVRLRFFAGDAISFCHTLQHRHVTGSERSAHWYRSRHTTLEPLVLIEDDYGTDGSAPVSFNVIDTSNLIDHVGGLNLLAAASPLLDGHASSSLYTETLVQRTHSQQEQLDQLLGGHLPTSSLLLGLFPVEYWTNTCHSSIGDEQLIRFILSQQEETTISMKQSYSRVTWKRPPYNSASQMERLHMDEEELAFLLYRVYVEMFPGENMERMLSIASINPESTLHASFPTYTRANFVSFLVLVKKRIVACWDRAIDILLARIECNRTLLTGRHYMQELYLYMHLLDIHSVDTFRSFATRDIGIGTAPKGVPSAAYWQNMPPSVCITLKVPRSALRVFTEPDPSTVGNLPVHGVVRDSSDRFMGWEHYFAAVQLGFGSLSTEGVPFSNTFELSITEDHKGWHGNCFCMQNTPVTAGRFTRQLGLDLSIFKTKLGDTDNVYISKNLPNQTGTITVPAFAEDAFASLTPEPVEFKITVTVMINPNTARIALMTARLDVISRILRSALLGSCPVQITPTSPCAFIVTVNETPITVTFPVPVIAESVRTRIARTSAYIELTALIIPDPAVYPSATFTSPLLFPNFPNSTTNNPVPILWNNPQTSLSTAPIISLSNPSALTFLPVHTGQMFSAREARVRSNPFLLAAATQPERTRIGLKESLYVLFMQFSGLDSKRNPTSRRNEPIFALYNPIAGACAVSMFIFPSTLRLDLARRTVLLDCAVLPVTYGILPTLERSGFLAAVGDQGGVHIKVDGDELRLWKEVLPAWVERCRAGEWAHRERCEYRVGPGRYRAPVSVEAGQEVVCGCGKGVFPVGWEVDVPMWEVVKRYCVRAAISPLFANALVEDVMADVETLGLTLGREKEGKGDGVTGCRNCAREKSREGGELKACGKCQKVRYCGRTCQRADWKRHKKDCIAKGS
ncbi:hypothetical protein C7999DRAFT_30550 [Corynascus novoguineensis]|uniref:MYND-type domain-containing protein n=1 Tax=Corynascus novoguineensis TaxID=1126955 RepID=A0AAN7HS28_9PEZI|nr:hypothetical protein C7999DRAFT_30550 [Corynascus novoguineensis]